MYFLLVATFLFLSYGYQFEMILHVKDMAWGFDIYHLKLEIKT